MIKKIYQFIRWCIAWFRVPRGPYCYSLGKYNPKTGFPSIRPCPYHKLKQDLPEQSSGYCCYFKSGDIDNPGLGLLWDMVKECDIKINDKDIDD